MSKKAPATRAEISKRWRERNPERYIELSRKYYAENKERHLRSSKEWRERNKGLLYGGTTTQYANTKVGWAKCKCNRLRSSAKQRGLEFNIEYTDILNLMVDVCPVLGIELNYELGGNKGKVLPCSPSVDRIDNSKGYTKDNIIIISQLANKVKHSLLLEEIPIVLEKVIEFYTRYL